MPLERVTEPTTAWSSACWLARTTVPCHLRQFEPGRRLPSGGFGVQSQGQGRVVGELALPSLMEVVAFTDQAGERGRDVQIVVAVTVSGPADPAVSLNPWRHGAEGVSQPA